MKYIDARLKPQTTSLVVNQPVVAPTNSVPAKYRGTAAADIQAVIEAAVDKVFEGVPSDIATRAVQQAIESPAFSPATAETVFFAFRRKVEEEKK